MTFRRGLSVILFKNGYAKTLFSCLIITITISCNRPPVIGQLHGPIILSPPLNPPITTLIRVTIVTNLRD